MRQKSKPDLVLRRKFGTKIRDLRKVAGISQEELGFKAGVHRTYIGSIERGEQNISLDNIGKLAKHLNTSLKNLFDL
jgi:transcriptional regulator with XRE-family HTH domain